MELHSHSPVDYSCDQTESPQCVQPQLTHTYIIYFPGVISVLQGIVWFAPSHWTKYIHVTTFHPLLVLGDRAPSVISLLDRDSNL